MAPKGPFEPKLFRDSMTPGSNSGSHQQAAAIVAGCPEVLSFHPPIPLASPHCTEESPAGCTGRPGEALPGQHQLRARPSSGVTPGPQDQRPKLPLLSWATPTPA